MPSFDFSPRCCCRYSTNRQVREQLYKAYIARASSGDHDNREIVESIRRLRYRADEILVASSQIVVYLLLLSVDLSIRSDLQRQ